MSSPSISSVFVIGGTGAQGMPIIRALVADQRYSVRFLSRDPDSRRAKELLALDNVSVLEGSFADEAKLREGFRGCDAAFVNIDGFNTGEKTEMYWAIRSYEIALEEGVKFFVYGNLDYGLKKSGYDSRFRTGHYDGKGRVGEWILFQNQVNGDKVNGDRMGAAVFTTGPYIEMVISPGTPMTPAVEDGVVTWRVPLGEGAVPHVALEDCGYYVRWLFDHPERANGIDLEVAVDHIAYADLAAAFEKVTGHPARYIDTDLDTYWRDGPLSGAADAPAGYNADPSDKSTMNVRDNYTGFWNLWKYGVVKRDYGLLDQIHPHRIRRAEEWFRREDQLGRSLGKGSLWERVQPQNRTPILKIGEDMRRGKL
ncbi:MULTISPECIES: NmrA family NAD(P)-binding protein [Mycobacterium]|uniref:NmrA family protein n=1 Tax=Mycobacterium colombiense TaxID=339268 RepID=A0A329LMW3_9MYCO|nr:MULTISPECIES: NmrA family NAD(P)-binding protein [Mycobacterium]MDM4140752.1 NmrA family NAD(P)-binding protein [Mycobacterium sp. FLAC0960]RAV08526.1 NmrA family protein [Mycobacterium colombiense]